jgi:hypothetical protein
MNGLQVLEQLATGSVYSDEFNTQQVGMFTLTSPGDQGQHLFYIVSAF